MEVNRMRIPITLGIGAAIGAGLVLNPATIIRHAQTIRNSSWFPAVSIGLYLSRPFLGWPITALSVLVGYQYGRPLGVPIAVLGAVASTFIPYLGVRYLEFDSGCSGGRPRRAPISSLRPAAFVG